MDKKTKYNELKKKIQDKYTEEDYINYFTYYFTKGYKEFDSNEKYDFYDNFQIALMAVDLISSKLFCEIDDICEEIDWGMAEVDPDYFIEFDKKFIKLLKEYGFLKEK